MHTQALYLRAVICSTLVASTLLAACTSEQGNGVGNSPQPNIRALYQAAPGDVHSRWASAENPYAEKGQGGLTNQGAKGDAFFIVAPGERKTIFDQKGAGLITRIWLTGTFVWAPEIRRMVRIDMFWDEAKKPAVSSPLTDFFGLGLGQLKTFENEFFSQPEGKSLNCFIPMPYKSGARIEVTNESEFYMMLYYDVDFLQLASHADDALYFHTYWSRSPKTELGNDFEILPKVAGKGRFLGANIGVIGNPDYKGTWFGEGEVKIYVDGDDDLPTLVGTGTEDYIGTGWGQGEFQHRFQGSLISDRDNDLYAFYRYHVPDPVYFHDDCRVTIQQIGNSQKPKILDMLEAGAELEVVWVYKFDNLSRSTTAPESLRLLDMENAPRVEDADFPIGSTNFYRRDDVSATAYFYLDRPENSLPELPSVDLRTLDLQERVFDVLNKD
jgi:hypothetical protein